MKEHIIINKDRTVVVPDSVRKIGIQYDHKVNTLTFDCPRYADDNQSIDMSRMAIYINFSRNDKTKGSIAATNIFVDPDNPEIMHFDVDITRSVTLVNGPIICLVCAKSTDAEGVEVNHWNSELFNKLSVGEGLEAEELTEEEIDYITSLLQEINTTRAEVADMDTRVEDLEFNQEKQGAVSEVDLEAMTWTEGSYITGSGTIGSSSGYGISELVTLPKMSTLILDATGYQSDIAMIAKSDRTPLVTSVDGKTHYEYYTDEEIQVYISCKSTEAKSAKIVRNVGETLSDLERENSEVKGDLEQLKQNGTGTGTGLPTEAIDKLEEVGNYLAYTTADGGSKWTELISILRNGSSGGGSGEIVPATGITLDKTTLSFTDSATQTLVATVEPSDTTDKVVWTSNAESVATVTNGVVKPLSNGLATITATCGSVSATCSVTVDIAEEEQVTLTSISATYTGGDVAVGTSLNDLTGITVTAHYSDGSTVNVTGYTLSGTIAEGSNTITVSYGGKTTTFTVVGIAESGGEDFETNGWTNGTAYNIDWIDGYRLRDEDLGEPQAFVGISITPFMPCQNVSRLNIVGTVYGSIFWYDAEQNYLRCTKSNTIIENTSIPTDAYYFRLSVRNENTSAFVATPYRDELLTETTAWEPDKFYRMEYTVGQSINSSTGAVVVDANRTVSSEGYCYGASTIEIFPCNGNIRFAFYDVDGEYLGNLVTPDTTTRTISVPETSKTFRYHDYSKVDSYNGWVKLS